MRSFLLLIVLAFFLSLPVMGNSVEIKSPEGNLKVMVFLNSSGELYYTVSYNGNEMIQNSPLGIITSVSKFDKGLSFVGKTEKVVDKHYSNGKIKHSNVRYQANEVVCTYKNGEGDRLSVVFSVSNNDVAFKYNLFPGGDIAGCVIEKELTGFKFPQNSTTFLTPQAAPMIGWMATKPSYEEEYVADEAMGTPSKYGVGHTFPALFHIGDRGWVLVSETGVSSLYCASKLSEGSSDGLYTVAFPEPGENNGVGSASPAIALPGETPWRTLTVSDNLKQIVETTIPFDLVDPMYAPSQEYRFGRGTWSWIMWQDNSMNWDDQITYIDLASQLGYEYILIDALWDTQIGYHRMPQLIEYARSKGVDVFLWYNSNGHWNNAPQGPKHKMDSSPARVKEMKWMRDNGVKGIKVDFFGGDKQETMKLYEDILVDANEYGLMVIFHGCTLPRGWERMYPNYVASEAVLDSENLIFNQHYHDNEAYNACLHPFIRNAVGSMDFGPVLLNRRLNRNNDGGSVRKTSDVFQLATAVLYQSPVQMFALTPNNLNDYPAFVIDFMKQIPTTWDETVFIDGYPGKYVVLARRHADKWYVVAVNAEADTKKITVKLPMIDDNSVNLYSDGKDKNAKLERVKLGKNGTINLTIPSGGGAIVTN